MIERLTDSPNQARNRFPSEGTAAPGAFPSGRIRTKSVDRGWLNMALPNRWPAFSLRAAQVAMAAQTVVALRTLPLASGGTRAYNGFAPMTIEKGTALAEARGCGG